MRSNDPTPLPAPTFQEMWLPDLQKDDTPVRDWLWFGYLKPGNVTLLTSPWKAGKTTLTAALLAGLHHGGILAGRTVRPGRAVVVSEEAAEQWQLRSQRFAFGPAV